jgi:preprotein translocase subunit SecG
MLRSRNGFDMTSFIIIIHIVVAVALILIVLLQTGKGADMGAAFGGGSSQTLFGGAGASTFLSRLTTIAAVVFMLTSLSLAYFSSHRAAESVMSQMPAPVTEQTEQAPSEAPTQPGALPSEEAPAQAEQVEQQAPVEPMAKQVDVTKKAPSAKEADAAKKAPEQSGKTKPIQKSE